MASSVSLGLRSQMCTPEPLTTSVPRLALCIPPSTSRRNRTLNQRDQVSRGEEQRQQNAPVCPAQHADEDSPGVEPHRHKHGSHGPAYYPGRNDICPEAVVCQCLRVAVVRAWRRRWVAHGGPGGWRRPGGRRLGLAHGRCVVGVMRLVLGVYGMASRSDNPSCRFSGDLTVERRRGTRRGEWPRGKSAGCVLFGSGPAGDKISTLGYCTFKREW